MSKFRRSTLLSIVIFLLSAALPAPGAMDYLLEEKISKAMTQLEALYERKDFDKVIQVSRQVMEKAAKDHPHRQRAYDLMVLAMEGKSRRVLAQEKAEQLSSAKKSAETLTAEASSLMTQGKHGEARDKLAQAVMSFGGDAEAHYMLGYCQQKLGNQADAYLSYKECLKINPDHPRALFHLSELSFKLKRFPEAEDVSRRLTKAIGKRLLELRDALFQQKAANLNDQAIATARKMAALKRNLAQAFYLLGILTERRGNLEESQRALSASAKFDPQPMDVHYHLGQVQLRLKAYHQAAQGFESALFIGETLLREENTRAKKLLDDGKADEAVEAGLKVKALEKRLALSQYGLALTLWKRGETGTAMESIEKALEYQADLRQARFARAVFLAEKGDFPSALAEVREVLKNAPPNSPEANLAIKTLKALMERSVEVAQGRKPGSGALLGGAKPRTISEPNAYVKDMPGLGGRKAEAEWQELFPVMKEVQDLVDRGNIPTAVVKLKALRGAHPNVVQIRSVLGTLYSEEGRLDDAISEFRDALAINPHDPESLANLAYLWAVKNLNLDKALGMAKEALEIDPNRAEFHHTLGWVWFRMGEMAKAIVELEEALKLKPNYILARYNLGLAHYLSGQFESALKAFETVVTDRPDHSKAAMFRGLTLAKLNKTPEAVEVLQGLKKKLPEGEVLGKVVGDLADRFKLANDRHQATPIPAIQHPAPLRSLLTKAREYRSKGLVNRAKELYLECQRLNPKAFTPYFELGQMYAQAQLYGPAERTWAQALELNPNDYNLQFNIGRMNHKLGRREKARVAFTAAQGLNPQDGEPPYYLGLIAYEEGRFESAESHALGALRLNAKHWKAMGLLGLARMRTANYRAARDIFETLYARAPRDAGIRRLARRKLWELSRLITPMNHPNYEDAMKQEEALRQKNEKAGQNSQLQEKWAKLNTDEKIQAYRNLSKFSHQALNGSGLAGENRTSSAPSPSDETANLTVDEKLAILKRLQNFKTMDRLYPSPPPKTTSKYKLHGPVAPVRQADPADADLKIALDAAEKGLMTQALGSFEKAEKASPKNLDVLLNLGFLNTLMGNFKNGFDFYARTTTWHPSNTFGKIGLGNLYWLGGRGAEAVQQWRSLRLGAAPDAVFHLYARSEKVWKRVLDANPTDVDAHSNLGVVYLFTGRFPEALAEFKAVLNLAPDRVEHVFYEAQIYTIMYINSRTAAHRREAKTRLADLANRPSPFPHALALLNFLDTL